METLRVHYDEAPREPNPRSSENSSSRLMTSASRIIEKAFPKGVYVIKETTAETKAGPRLELKLAVLDNLKSHRERLQELGFKEISDVEENQEDNQEDRSNK